jgi:hypothetical protein
MSLSVEEIKKNKVAIANAFVNNVDTNQGGNEKSIGVISAIWKWEHVEQPCHFGSGYAVRSNYYATRDIILNCSCIKDQVGGVSSTFSTAFQHFEYIKKYNLITIRGNKEGRNYSVEIQCGSLSNNIIKIIKHSSSALRSTLKD